MPKNLDSLISPGGWTEWVPLADTVGRNAPVRVPDRPGVYMCRNSSEMIYVGVAKKRGLRERLAEYPRGNDLNGLAEVVFDLALNDRKWLESRIEALNVERPTRAKDWVKRALTDAEIQVRWNVRADPADAVDFESSVLAALKGSGLLLNRPTRN